MLVQKFGGTSVGKPERMQHIARLIDESEKPTIVVLSAVAGTTNALVDINTSYKANDRKQALEKITALKSTYIPFVEELYSTPKSKKAGMDIIDHYFNEIIRLISQPYYPQIEKVIIVQGELISTNLFQEYLKESGQTFQ